MGKAIILALLLAYLPTVSAACRAPGNHVYYFFTKPQETFRQAEFVALVRMLEFQPAVFEQKQHTDTQGKIWTGRRLVRPPKASLEIIEVLTGQATHKTISQDLTVTSCSHYFAADRTQGVFVVAGAVEDKMPRLRAYRVDSEGLY